ncbi:MAG: hypothetical protein ACYCTE_03885 [Acidimicrobiales bacterium]
MTTTRARAALARMHPLPAGIGAYAVVSLVVHDVAALVVLALAVALVEVAIHRRARLERPGWRPGRVVELVIGAALVRRDGIVRPLLALVVGGALAVGVGLVSLAVVASAAHGLGVLAGGLVAALVALWHRHERVTA